MKTISPEWPDNYKDAVALQERLRASVSRTGRVDNLRLVAGADVSYSKGSDSYHACVVVLEYPAMTVVEESCVTAKSTFPYIPGLLSFREGPIILEAFNNLCRRPDLVVFDGQGIAHPRGLGVASHMGLLFGIPTIGCAKSVLVGKFEEPDIKRGSWSPLIYKGETVGRALRTKDKIKPVFVSIGHMVDLDFAAEVVLSCAKGYRLPEPTRQAHLRVNKVRIGKETF